MMPDSETRQSVVVTAVASRHFTMEESGTRTEGIMQAIEVEEATGYVWFVSSDGDRVAGCAPD